MSQATGIPEKFASMPLGKRAMTIPVLPFQGSQYMLKVFGRNDLREVICERDTKPNIGQVMHLVSGDTIQHQVTAKNGNLDSWLSDATLADRDIVDRIYLAALTRHAMPDEVTAALEPISGKTADPAARRRAFEDVLWTVFNSKEFLFHH
jgi:hypothetical protein